jgi:hypothetical protein
MKSIGRLLRIIIANLEATGVNVVVINGEDDRTPQEAIEYFKQPAIQEADFNYMYQEGSKNVLLLW